MKRKSNLYHQMLDYENVLSVSHDVLKKCHNKEESLAFRRALNTNIYDIINRLKNYEYEFSSYRIFLIREPKYRIIMSENLSDKIVNHLISRYILLPSLEPVLIDTNVATRVNKGSDYAFKKFCEYINKIGLDKKIYVLKIDISKYFYNINHSILYEKLKRRIKEKESLEIIRKVLNTTNYEYINSRLDSIINYELLKVNNSKLSLKEKSLKTDMLESLPRYKLNKGLPIGNMTSQILAVFYLNDVDHYIKETLGIKYYIRYMDDLVILDTSLDKLKEWFSLIKEKIMQEDLEVNKKSSIYSLNNYVSFLGYTFRIKYNTLWIRYHNKTIRRINSKLRKGKLYNYDLYYKSIKSYKGYFMKANTSCYYKNLKRKEITNMYNKYLKLKKDWESAIVLLKSGKFYRTYDDDAIILNYLFNYQIIDNRVGFPIESLFKIKRKFKNSNIDYIVLDRSDVYHETYEDNSYHDLLMDARVKYDCEIKKEELMNSIKEKLNNNPCFYDELKSFVLNN